MQYIKIGVAVIVGLLAIPFVFLGALMLAQGWTIPSLLVVGIIGWGIHDLYSTFSS